MIINSEISFLCQTVWLWGESGWHVMRHNHVVDSYLGGKTAIVITLYTLLANTVCVFMCVSDQDGWKKGGLLSASCRGRNV